MMFLALLFFIYCVVGGIVGAVCWMQEKWPKYMGDSPTLIDAGPTVLFFVFCGPAFWVGSLIFVIFRAVVKILK